MIVLPFPPSVNLLWRSVKGRTILSADGRSYRKAVGLNVFMGGASIPYNITAPVSVNISAYLPDARRRDLDNLLKASLDGLTHAGIWKDDSQIKRLTIEHCGIDRVNPRLEVEVTPL